MTAIEFEVTVECSECHTELSASSRLDRHGRVTVDVDPCDKCLTEANSEGYKEAESDMEERQ